MMNEITLIRKDGWKAIVSNLRQLKRQNLKKIERIDILLKDPLVVVRITEKGIKVVKVKTKEVSDMKLVEIANKVRAFLLEELDKTVDEEHHLTPDDFSSYAERRNYIKNAKLKKLLEEFDEEKLELVLNSEEIEYLKKRKLW